ncbi:2-oxoisovalerate dehydrogenase subunit beta, mitochondrial [Porphyridium purpureum]|uniref:3-methyl-2-oxobutanoate dehydrogenase (2-methylpropanoyl-transferring) n=1 Tax=Porphyridium purpureum TaxID=35688 RepID=A0A5J4YTG3_PORPP|nr:2-oxoisovalerate dehydrogenase subunit beta, mitochondrial [Porphyridium purpureum]|eukprot:POR7401..scf227_4
MTPDAMQALGVRRLCKLAAQLQTPRARQARDWSRGCATGLQQPPLLAVEPGEQGTKSMNLFQAINDALRLSLETDPSAIIFGEDVAFGGVFRCTTGLREKFGADRVFNTPLSEQGICGMAVGYASSGCTAIAEIQFADYIYPAFDQLTNEAAKFRYRSGGQYDCGGLVVRAPCGAVGHGGHYHSQSPEAYFTHTPGLKVVMVRDPISAKGLLRSAVRCKDPVVFFEPKALYRTSIADVPVRDYEIPLGVGQIVRSGDDLTLVAWGNQVNVCLAVAEMAEQELQASCEVIDLMSLLPWDRDLVMNSVRKTGRAIVSHEAPRTSGFGAEIVASIQEHCFYSLEAPVARVTGWDTPFPLVHEAYYLPNKYRMFDSIKQVLGVHDDARKFVKSVLRDHVVAQL